MPKQNTIPALAKSVRVLEAIAGGAHNHSVAELSRELKIPQTTCYRILQTLIAADWLRPRSAGVGYELSHGMLPLVQPFLSHRVLIDAVRGPLDRLVQRTGLSAKLSVRQADEAVTVFRVESHQPMSISGRVGVRFHLAHGSSGACLLSGMSDEQIRTVLGRAPAAVWSRQEEADVWARIAQCRADGFCLDAGRFHPSIQTLSAPLRDQAGQPLATLTLLAFASDDPAEQVAARRDDLLETIDQCQRLITRDGVAPAPESKGPQP